MQVFEVVQTVGVMAVSGALVGLGSVALQRRGRARRVAGIALLAAVPALFLWHAHRVLGSRTRSGELEAELTYAAHRACSDLTLPQEHCGELAECGVRQLREEHGDRTAAQFVSWLDSHRPGAPADASSEELVRGAGFDRELRGELARAFGACAARFSSARFLRHCEAQCDASVSGSTCGPDYCSCVLDKLRAGVPADGDLFAELEQFFGDLSPSKRALRESCAPANESEEDAAVWKRFLAPSEREVADPVWLEERAAIAAEQAAEHERILLEKEREARRALHEAAKAQDEEDRRAERAGELSDRRDHEYTDEEIARAKRSLREPLDGQ